MKKLQFFLFALLLSLFPAVLSAADDIFQSFLKPYHQVEMLSVQRERLIKLHVQEGDRVSKGQLLASFDSRVLQARLHLARTAIDFHGAQDAARALVAMRENKLATLKELEKSGNARPQEVNTVRTNLAMAEAQLQEAREKIKLREAEKKVILAQIEEKQLHSPIDGLVIRLVKQEGELVGGTDQEPIMIIAQLDPLLAEFHVPPELAGTIPIGSELTVRIGRDSVKATVSTVSPVIDAKSGTVHIRLTLPNPKNRLQSGSRIFLSLPSQSEHNDGSGIQQQATNQGSLQ